MTLFALLLAAAPARALDPATLVGPKACQECHAAEHGVWSASKHSTGFRQVHRSPVAKDVLAKVGGEANMRKHPACAACHFTPELKDGAPVVANGVTCEACHGPAKDWLRVHNDYGGEGIAREKETAEHKARRLAAVKKAGMIRPEMRYDAAENCMACHGLARPEVGAEVFAQMLEAGHPFDADFDLVRYSQGSVRHRFYPPDPAVNQELSEAEKARLFVIGQAAKLVSATLAAKTEVEAYKKAQLQRVESARAALAEVRDVPEVQALLDEPSEANARRVADAVADRDLAESLRDLLPAPAELK